MKNLGFVDRLVSPWMETAQRSASMRLFQQYSSGGMAERASAPVSWVFPRPWYQDELDWLAASRQAPRAESYDGSTASTPAMLTTRGTYVSSQHTATAAATVMPSALYEYVAPSLSINQPLGAAMGIDGGARQAMRSEAYSPLVSLAAVQAAHLMERAVAPMMRPRSTTSNLAVSSPALRRVLASMLERASITTTHPTRLAEFAPELVTPPAPRADDAHTPSTDETATSSSTAAAIAFAASAPAVQARELAQQFAEQRAQIAEVTRIAQVVAQRELAARVVQPAITTTTASPGEREAVVAATQTRAAGAEAERVVAQQREERARIEERIAARVAERTTANAAAQGQHRLHEQARATAAEHALTLTEARAAEPAVVAAPAAAAGHPVPAEVLSAIAALPPQLASFLTAQAGRMAGGAVAAIAELNNALRAVELMAHGAASNQPMVPTRGPQLMMPAGLGGLVAGVDRAAAIAERPGALTGATPFLPTMLGQPLAIAMPTTASVASSTPGLFTRRAVPSIAMTHLHPQGLGGAQAPTSALAAAAASPPAALAHVAWADRWLARFAGASQHSLDTIAAGATANPAVRLQALLATAPDAVFVAPTFDTERAAPRVRVDSSGQVHVSPSAQSMSAAQVAPTTSTGPQLRPVDTRVDDSAEVSDDVFTAIAAAAATKRTRTAATPLAAASTPTAMQLDPHRVGAADLLAMAVPGAPGSGLSAGLASSPFASALRHVLPLAAAPSFDIRSLFGGGMASTYLAGLLEPSAHEISILSSSGASLGNSIGALTSTFASSVGADGTIDMAVLQRELNLPAGFEATYVAMSATDQHAAVESSPEMQKVVEAAVAAGLPVELARAVAQGVAPASQAEPLTTLRTALLAWQHDASPAGMATLAAALGPVANSPMAALLGTGGMASARQLLGSLSMPLLGEGAVASDASTQAAWNAPGMLAERAQNWSIAQERSSMDLAFDFVSPELVLAARVYGLGPAEAAQASRLALAGPGQLAAMAGAVDRTFVQAMAMDAGRRQGAESITQVSGSRAGLPSPWAGTAATQFTTGEAASGTRRELPTFDGDLSQLIASAAFASPAKQSFGVARRSPRGAFLWPAATVAALNLSAAGPDGGQGTHVAALELLAAQAVAELGTFTALGIDQIRDGGAGALSSSSDATGSRGTAVRRPTTGTKTGEAAAEPAESDVLSAAMALMPTARRSRFEALYIALGQSAAGKDWSPAARAARALALAGRGDGDGATASARERAAMAWDVLPIVYADAMDDELPSHSMGTGAARAMRGTPSMTALSGGRSIASRAQAGVRTSFDAPQIDGRPGLGALSARAGEALGAYVQPTGMSTTSSAQQYSPSQDGALRRVPTAAQEMVQTGRPAGGRHGGGEVEIPAWFENAAKRMFADRSGSGPSGGISMTELTLVSSAPSTQIAADSIAPAQASPHTSSPMAAGDHNKHEPIDVESVADDVYKHIMTMMDSARGRNGEPFL